MGRGSAVSGAAVRGQLTLLTLLPGTGPLLTVRLTIDVSCCCLANVSGENSFLSLFSTSCTGTMSDDAAMQRAMFASFAKAGPSPPRSTFLDHSSDLRSTPPARATFGRRNDLAREGMYTKSGGKTKAGAAAQQSPARSRRTGSRAGESMAPPRIRDRSVLLQWCIDCTVEGGVLSWATRNAECTCALR